jgi:capsid protein
MLKLDFSQTNYSNARAALIQTYKTFETWQEWLSRGFLQRVWNWRIAKAIRAKDLPPAPRVDGVNQWFRVQWSFPSYEWIDPQNQTQSELLGYQMGKTSLTRVIRSTGADVEDVLREKASELILAKRICDEAKAQGVTITPDMLIHATIPGQVNKQTGEPVQEKEEKGKDNDASDKKDE